MQWHNWYRLTVLLCLIFTELHLKHYMTMTICLACFKYWTNILLCVQDDLLVNLLHSLFGYEPCFAITNERQHLVCTSFYSLVPSMAGILHPDPYGTRGDNDCHALQTVLESPTRRINRQTDRQTDTPRARWKGRKLSDRSRDSRPTYGFRYGDSTFLPSKLGMVVGCKLA